jgi:antitoxin CptB
MADDLEIRRRRAAYRACHRGTKEMDIVIGRYATARLAGMSEGELSLFERLLALPDPVLSDWFSHGAAVDDAEFATLVSDLRRYHGLAADES